MKYRQIQAAARVWSEAVCHYVAAIHCGAAIVRPGPDDELMTAVFAGALGRIGQAA
ncbi:MULTISPECIES: hypothetical protein [Xanthomonas]|uniref:hypothetical protein n=1 Tax=Xanthomonas TaxID=338 RepID=UPI0012F800A4|nr:MULTISPECIES: hypothetical protein [Xanthomonas]MDS0834596.1 hypothetical protein [Xanthomonas citri pv. punicae]WPM76724.1 hypothetical protein XVT_00220 [Xanthomonas citri pv. viticola]